VTVVFSALWERWGEVLLLGMAHGAGAPGDGGPASPRCVDADADAGVAARVPGPGPPAPRAWPARRQRRRVAAALAAALVLAACAALLGVAVDRASSPGAWGGGGRARASGGGRRPALELLQQDLDAFDDDDFGGGGGGGGLDDSDDGEDDDDDDDDDGGVNVRDDMLASAPSRTQTLSWLDWNEDDIEREEATIKQKLITIEQGLIAQPQRLNEMKVAMGKVREYYGENGKLRAGVPEALKSVQVQMQRAEDEIMQSERMRRLTADIRAIREGAARFLAAQKSKDWNQDSLLQWTETAERKFMGTSHEHFKTLKRHLRGDERDVQRFYSDVKSWRRENRRRIDRAVRRKEEELRAKGKELMVRFFGEGGKHMRGKTRGRKRKDGLWDAIEDEANANVSTGLAASFAKWDAAVREMDGAMHNISTGLGQLPVAIGAWDLNVTWRLGNLSHSIARFRQLNDNFTIPLSAEGRQQWKDIQALQDAIDHLAEQRAVAMDPCIGARETAQALSILIALLTTRANTAMFDDLEGQKRLNAVRSAFYALESKLLNDEDRKRMFKVLLGTASDKNDTATAEEHAAESQYSQVLIVAFPALFLRPLSCCCLLSCRFLLPRRARQRPCSARLP